MYFRILCWGYPFLNITDYFAKIRFYTKLAEFSCTVVRRLTTGICSEKFVVRRFCHCANIVECTCTDLDSIAYYTPRLYGIAYCSYATNLCSMLPYRIL